MIREVRQKAVVKGGRIELPSDLPEGTAVEVTVAPARAVPSLEGLRGRRAEILAIVAKYGGSNLRVFGSVVRGQANPDSDVDFLVELAPGRSLWDLGGMIADLEDLLGVKADVGTVSSLRPEIKDEVLAEARPL